MKFKLLACVLCVALIIPVALAGCGSSTAPAASAAPAASSAPAASGPIVFKLSHVFTPLQTTHLVLTEVAENINKRTDGQIEIQIYPDSQIPTGLDGVEQCIRGAYFINVYDPGCLADWVPDYNALIGPMLYETAEEYSAVCQSDFAKSLNAKAEENGVKVLALDYNFGMRNMATVKKQITSIDDIQGLKIRVPKSQLWIDTFTALGTSPVPIGWGELYNSLQQGVVDAYETSISDMYDNQMWEVSNYVTKTAHFIGTGAVMLSKQVWDSLTPEQQAIMEEEFLAGAIKNNEMSMEDERTAQEKMEERGMVFNEVELEPFVEKAKAAFDSFPNLSPGVYDTIVAEVEKFRASK